MSASTSWYTNWKVWLIVGVVVVVALAIAIPLGVVYGGSQGVVQVNTLVVGGGVAGLYYAYRHSSIDSDFVVLESNAELGGNVKDKQFKDPLNPSGPFPTDPPLRLGRGALRINQLSFKNQRCLANELGIQVEFSAFRGAYTGRGQTLMCRAPQWQGNDQPDDPYSASPFATSDNCSGDKKWVGPVSVVNQTTNTCPVISTTGSNDLPSPRFLNVNTNEKAVVDYITGYSNVDPSTGRVECELTEGISCFMRAFCSNVEDRKKTQMFGTYLSDTFGRETYALLQQFNYGFLWDYEAASACAWAEWTQREYDTNSVNGYPVGGMSEFILRMTAAIQMRVPESIKTSHTVLSIDKEGQGYFVTVKNEISNSILKYRAKNLVLGLPPSPLSRIQGSLVDELKESMVFNNSIKVQPVTVNLQFPTAWWTSLVGSQGASFRFMGTTGCFQRTEFHQTPYLSKVQAIRAVYSDTNCADLFHFMNTLPEPQRTNEASRRAMVELRLNFPELTIPDPVGYPRASADDYIGASFDVWNDGAWHWSAPFSTISNDENRRWAEAPLGTDASVCLSGDAWYLDYSGWISSGIRGSEACLNRFQPGRQAEWKPSATTCCEFRQTTNATVNGTSWYNYPFRYGFQGCGEENWSPGAAYLKYETWWPTYEAWQSAAGSNECIMPLNANGEPDTELCGVNRSLYMRPGNAKRAKSKTRRVHPSMVTHGR